MTTLQPPSLLHLPFVYMRHGQTEWNLQNRAMGQQDIPLNQTVIEQAIGARRLLKGHQVDVICYSLLQRAKMTAEILNEHMQCRMVCIDDLKEFYLGRFEGRVKGEWFADWKAGKIQEDVEPYHEFLNRALRGINQALAFSPKVLIVAHGGVYWAIHHYGALTGNSDISNCTPLLHRPPSLQHDKWERTQLGIDE